MGVIFSGKFLMGAGRKMILNATLGQMYHSSALILISKEVCMKTYRYI
jgi:hypothetical protein